MRSIPQRHDVTARNSGGRSREARELLCGCLRDAGVAEFIILTDAAAMHAVGRASTTQPAASG
jgi:hypothetical protein